MVAYCMINVLYSFGRGSELEYKRFFNRPVWPKFRENEKRCRLRNTQATVTDTATMHMGRK